MKALSIRQPWADLILQGKKTLELRNWKTSHHGTLVIHASQKVDETACHTFGIDPRKVSTGVILGVVELAGIIPLDEATFTSLRSEHLSQEPFHAPLYGWKLTQPIPLEHPIPYTGRMSLFDVPDQVVSTAPVIESQQVLIEEGAVLDSRLPFELQVKLETGAGPSTAKSTYRLALYQRSILPSDSPSQLLPTIPKQQRLICELGGSALKSVADVVLEALRQNGYAATDLNAKRREPFQLTEESGVRLALIFLAVRPITKVARIEEISRGIRAMTGEELYYWFAKCTTPNSAERAQRALRMLLAEE